VTGQPNRSEIMSTSPDASCASAFNRNSMRPWRSLPVTA
jgi:hypothetical protein